MKIKIASVIIGSETNCITIALRQASRYMSYLKLKKIETTGHANYFWYPIIRRKHKT